MLGPQKCGGRDALQNMKTGLRIQRSGVTARPSRAIGTGVIGHIRRMRRSELPDDTVELARFLVGKVLVRDHRRGRTTGRIVETEAYPVGDAAGHAFIGMTPANRSLFLAKGHAYVYFIYGSSYMCNVAAERRGVGAGVLLRALEPLEGISLMQHRRGSRPRWRSIATATESTCAPPGLFGWVRMSGPAYVPPGVFASD
jgi:hypothetical protein